MFAIVGPTGTGKTALSIALALELGGPKQVEIISADAMQLYRGMDIGTAKLPVAERRGIVHHQIDVLDITETASVAAYQRSARADVEAIRTAGKIPIVVGGSGLYIAGLLDELEFPGTDPEIRAELEAVHASAGLGPLVAELREKDPVSAGIIDLANPRRVIRALEVLRLTGHSYTPVLPRHTSHYEGVRFVGVRREKEELERAIFARAGHMFAGGLVEETRQLVDLGLRTSPTAAKATGYAQALQVIDGELTVDQAIESVAIATNRLAKKQRTWFRPDKRIKWYDVVDVASIQAIAKELAAEYRRA